MVYNAVVRIDLFLKASRLVKRRSLAQELCESGRVLVNDRQAKPAKDVKPGDRITLHFTSRHIELQMLAEPAGPSRKLPPEELYRVTSDKRTTSDREPWNNNLS